MKSTISEARMIIAGNEPVWIVRARHSAESWQYVKSCRCGKYELTVNPEEAKHFSLRAAKKHCGEIGIIYSHL